MRIYALRALAVILGGAALCLGCVELMSVGIASVPEARRAHYEMFVKTPFTILSYLSIAVGLYFFYLAVIAARKRTAVKLLIATLLYFILFPGAYLGIEHYRPAGAMTSSSADLSHG